MPKILGAILALAMLSTAHQANAIMAIKQFSINPTKSEMIFTDKASNQTETFAGTAVGKIHEMSSNDGKTARMRIYKMKAGDYAAVEMRGHSADKDGLYLLKATANGTESIKIQDRSITTIEALEKNVLHPAKAQGMGVGAVYGSLEQNDAKLIFVDASGEDEGSYDDQDVPPQDYDQNYDEGYEQQVPRDQGGFQEEQFFQQQQGWQGGCVQGNCGNWGRVIVRPRPPVFVIPVIPVPPVCMGCPPPPPPCWNNGCGNGGWNGGFIPPRPLPSPWMGY